MSDMFATYDDLKAKFPQETVTETTTEDHKLPDGSTLVLLRLDNGVPKRPNTLGPGSLLALGRQLLTQQSRAEAGEIAGLAITGSGTALAAGADIVSARHLSEADDGVRLSELGHDVYALLEDFPVPTIAWINGSALGGGLELALAAHYRVVNDAASGLGLPEVFLGLVPGWGGLYRLPRLVGPEAAAEIIFANPLNSNKTLAAEQAYEVGLADSLSSAESFEADALAFTATVLDQNTEVMEQITARRRHDDSAEAWSRAVDHASKIIAQKTADTAPGPLRALDIFTQVQESNREEDRAREVQALGELLVSDEFRNVVYGFMDLVQKRAKKPAGVPSVEPAEVHRIGVIGAGLMASQLALLFATSLHVPVVLTDTSQERIDKGLDYISQQLQRRVQKGQLDADSAQKLTALVTGSADHSGFAEADFVIEAVFEELEVKKQVFAQIEKVVSADAILATNTSSLSVTAMTEHLEHPERVIGFHFFNPVTRMPLVEIARTEHSTDLTLATAFSLASKLRKTPVLTSDSTAFVVNRVLLRLMSEVQKSFDHGTPAATADTALKPLNLPMTPFELLAMVGLPVSQRVTESLAASFGDRFHVSPNIQALIDAGVTQIWETTDDGSTVIPESTQELMTQGNHPQTSEELFTTVVDALAEEIGLMLNEGVVASAEDIDLCMILGAGLPFHRGGITPYLDQIGASERVNGKTFHPTGS